MYIDYKQYLFPLVVRARSNKAPEDIVKYSVCMGVRFWQIQIL